MSFPLAGDAIGGGGVPEPAAADTGTACHPSDLEPGSEERIPGPSGLESCSPATPERAQVPSETIPSTNSTSGGGGGDRVSEILMSRGYDRKLSYILY